MLQSPRELEVRRQWPRRSFGTPGPVQHPRMAEVAARQKPVVTRLRRGPCVDCMEQLTWCKKSKHFALLIVQVNFVADCVNTTVMSVNSRMSSR